MSFFTKALGLPALFKHPRMELHTPAVSCSFLKHFRLSIRYLAASSLRINFAIRNPNYFCYGYRTQEAVLSHPNLQKLSRVGLGRQAMSNHSKWEQYYLVRLGQASLDCRNIKNFLLLLLTG